MIVSMSRLLVVGPKRLLPAALEALQEIGTVHIDQVRAEEIDALTFPVEDTLRAERETLERLRTRADALLSLLPVVPGESVPTTAGLVGEPLEALESEIARIEEQVQPLVRARAEAQDELELIRTYESAVRVLAPLLGALAGSRSFETVGFILRTNDLTLVQDVRSKLEDLTHGRVEVVSRTLEEGKIGVVVAFHRRDAEAVHGFLARAGLAELRLPRTYANMPPADAIKAMEDRRELLPKEIARLAAELEAAARSHRTRLRAIRAVLQDRLARLQVVPQLAQSRYTFVVNGWTPTRAVPAIRQRLRRRFGDEIVVYDTAADPHEAERIPVLLDNPAPIRPFQLLLAIFPPPRYGTWDPSPLIAVTFPLFVGLVIGDVGLGVLFFLAGWALRNRARAGKPLVISFMNVTLQPPLAAAVSWLIRVIAFWVVVFGLIFAEAFGNLPELFLHVHPIFNRLAPENSTIYFGSIILLGMLMVYLGLLWHLVMSVRHRHITGVFESLVLIGASAALLIFLGTQSSPPMLPAALAPWSLYLLALAGAALVGALLTRNLMSAMWILESFTVFGHVLSHVRLMAFGLAAAILPLAANQIGPQIAQELHVPGILGRIFATLVAVTFQVLFFIFTIIGHLIQPARLHWVEFLMKVKYFDETGRKYQPFQTAGGG